MPVSTMVHQSLKKIPYPGGLYLRLPPFGLHNICGIRTPFFSNARYAPDRSEDKIKKKERGVGRVLHYLYSAFGFYKFISPRPPHFLSASYAPGYIR